MNLYTCSNKLAVSARRNFEWRGNRWTFTIEGSYLANDDEQVLRVDMTRDEALRMRRDLNTLLKATATPRKPRG